MGNLEIIFPPPLGLETLRDIRDNSPGPGTSLLTILIPYFLPMHFLN
jgi:hypothetical protein